MTLIQITVSCSGNDSLEKALRIAGDNHTEMLEAILYFEGDKEKSEAVEWLIGNMPGNHTLGGHALKSYQGYYHLFSKTGKEAIPRIDSLVKDEGFSVRALTKYEDLRHMKTQYLLHDINLAFKMRDNLPWCADIKKDNFFRYVLPYRIGDEELSCWRDSVLFAFSPVIDSLVAAGVDDPLVAAQAIMEHWNRKEFRWTGQLPSGPALGYANVTDKAGTCREFAHGVVYLMRAAGIPSGIDMVPVRGENSAGHSWPFIIGKDGRTYVTCTENPSFVPAPEFDIVAAKIYREEFGINDSMDTELPSETSMRPKFLRIPKLTDVTAVYKPSGSHDIELPDIEGGGTVYLASWGNNEWVAVGFHTGSSRPVFHNVSQGVVLVAARMEDNVLSPICLPFVVEEGGVIRKIGPGGTEGMLTAYSKFPLNERNGELVYRSIDGVIEGSDEPSFSVRDTVFRISGLAKRRVNYVTLPAQSRPHRYYRYYGAEGSNCNIAEIGLYADTSDSLPLRGRVFGTPGAVDGDTAHDYRKVFDGDIFTSFDYKEKSGGWAALDLGYPVSVGKVMFVPRNRDNYVREGDEYELFWFGSCRWNSAGRKRATADSVDFQTPQGTLYYLKNHTRGRSERIFEYDFEKREQKFW
ncbi:MAG: transglutaminase-like domain-containing protein [Muribaculaceae bacterium]|nr:transglutaminase-like domain-containing protein [Muribaculaceae bacterium]